MSINTSEEKEEIKKSFDFYKPIAHVAQKISSYNDKKTFFFSFLLALFLSLGILLSTHLNSSWDNHIIQSQKAMIAKITSEKKSLVIKQNMKEIKIQTLSLDNQSLKQKVRQLTTEKNAQTSATYLKKVQLIQNISDQNFQNFQNYLIKNLTIYTPEVSLMQKSITDAYNQALSEQSSNNAVLSIEHAKTLGVLLFKHQENLNKIITDVQNIHDNVKNNIPIQPDDLSLFFHYYDKYQSKTIIHSKPLENEIQKLLYFNNSNQGEYVDMNAQYNQKNNIYTKIQQMNQDMNNAFQSP